MAKFRAIVPAIWDDEWFSSASRNEQIFWVFLLTNNYAQASGLYEINWRVARTLLRMSDTVLTQCQQSVRHNAHTMFSDNWVLILNYIRYQPRLNPSIWANILSQIEAAPIPLLRAWLDHNAAIVPRECRDTVKSLEALCCTETETETETDIKEKTLVETAQKPPVSTCPFGELREKFNRWANYYELPNVRRLGDSRKRKLGQRWQEWGNTDDERWYTWGEVWVAVGQSPHLLGENDRGWKMTLDFLIKNDSNWQKVLEGAYKGKSEKKATLKDWEKGDE